MTKKATLKKQGFLSKDIPVRKLKSGLGLEKFNATRIRDKEFIFRALWQCLVENDTESFKEILRTHLDAVNKQEFSKKSTPSIRTLYRILSPEGNPTLKNISSVIHTLYR